MAATFLSLAAMRTTIVESTRVTENTSKPTNRAANGLTRPARPASEFQTGINRGLPESIPASAVSSEHQHNLVEALAESKTFQDFTRAFGQCTGLPLALRPVDSWKLAYHASPRENLFCAAMSRKSKTCSACLQVQQRLNEVATDCPQTVVCPAGLAETAIPLKVAGQLIGFLQTGQIFTRRPSPAHFDRVAKMAVDAGLPESLDDLKRTYYATPTYSAERQQAVVSLLAVFAQHLAILGYQIVARRQNAEPPTITRAKAYIREHYTDHLSLGEVAKAVNTSSFYFCKLFKRATGLNFTDYVCRIRIDEAKNRLLNPNLQVSEIAFDVGFESLTHFNRVFKRLVGQPPSGYREQLRGK